jgi:hypothetical protein
MDILYQPKMESGLTRDTSFGGYAFITSIIHNPSYSPIIEKVCIYSKQGALMGFFLGGFRGARNAAFVFKAEHQHLKLVGLREKYMYFKLRNYRLFSGFGIEGWKWAWRMGLVCGLFAALERSLAFGRGKWYSYQQDLEENRNVNTTATVDTDIRYQREERSAIPIYYDDMFNVLASSSLIGSSFGIYGPRRIQKIKSGIYHGLIMGSLICCLKAAGFTTI